MEWEEGWKTREKQGKTEAAKWSKTDLKQEERRKKKEVETNLKQEEEISRTKRK